MAEAAERVTEAAARRRRTAYGLNTVLAVLLLLAIVTLVEALSYTHNRRFDLTEGSRQSLADQSVKVLRGLAGPVKAVAFTAPDRGDRAFLENLLRLYAYHSDRFTFEVVDLHAEKQIELTARPSSMTSCCSSAHPHATSCAGCCRRRSAKSPVS